jgi:hypothetical protein
MEKYKQTCIIYQQEEQLSQIILNHKRQQTFRV